MMRPCLTCGSPSPGTRCPACQAERDARTDAARGSFRQRGYGRGWDTLSRRARRLQPFCSDCGSQENLTCDHLPGAWEKVAAGKRLTLRDVDVVCAGCNNRRGARRSAPVPTGGNPRSGTPVPANQAEFALLPTSPVGLRSS